MIRSLLMAVVVACPFPSHDQPVPSVSAPSIEHPAQQTSIQPVGKGKECGDAIRRQIANTRAIVMEGSVTEAEESLTGTTVRPPKALETISFVSRMGQDKIRTEIYDESGKLAYAFSSVDGRIRELAPSAHLLKRGLEGQKNVLLEYDGPVGRIERPVLTDNGCYFGACAASWLQPTKPGMEYLLLHMEDGQFLGEVLRSGTMCYHFRNVYEIEAKAKTEIEHIQHDVYVAKEPLRFVAWETKQRRVDGLRTTRSREYRKIEFRPRDSDVDWDWNVVPTVFKSEVHEGRPGDRSTQPADAKGDQRDK